MFYVLLLARLVAAAEQDHQPVVSNRVVDAVAFANGHAHFADALTHGFVVTKVALLNAVNANGDSRLGAPVAQSLQPAKKDTALDHLIVHEIICIQLATLCQVEKGF